MFEDIKSATIDAGSGDRVLVYAIWSRDTASSLPVAEAWRVLGERYPDDARFLLLALLEEVDHRPASWTPGAFLAELWKMLERAGGKLNPEARDLLAVVADELHPLEEADSARLERIRGRVGARVGDAAAAKKRLSRLASNVVRELHDRTLGNASIGRMPAAASASPYEEAMASAVGEKRAYDATARYETNALVEHPKFGVGVVVGIEPGRVHVLFESGLRKLVSG